MKRFARRAAACAVALPVLAAARAPAPDPLDAAAAVPPLEYRSAFADYRTYDEPARADWREVNRTVDEVARKIGQGAPGAAQPAARSGPGAGAGAGAGAGTGHHGHGPAGQGASR